MKLKLILSAALLAGVISTNAVTAPAPMSTDTNASPEATMKALFGDPVVVTVYDPDQTLIGGVEKKKS